MPMYYTCSLKVNRYHEIESPHFHRNIIFSIFMSLSRSYHLKPVNCTRCSSVNKRKGYGYVMTTVTQQK